MNDHIKELRDAILAALRSEGSVDDDNSADRGDNTGYPEHYALFGNTNLTRVAEFVERWMKEHCIH